MSPIILASDAMDSSTSSSFNSTGRSSFLFSSFGTAALSVMSEPPSLNAPTATPASALVVMGHGLPALVSQVPVADITTSTDLSFCLTTSLAFLKTLTWEQTPWVPHQIDHTSVSPISPGDALTIHHRLRKHFKGISPAAINNGLFFASAYPTGDVPVGSIGPYPHLFVIFPHARTHVATDARFLKIWHDQIVKPAFDRAWKDSGHATMYGAEIHGKPRILQPTGVRTANDAPNSTGILIRLHNQHPESVRGYWPQWSEKEATRRTEVMTEVWDAIKGMLKDHPDLADFQDPILLAVSRSQLDFSAQFSLNDMYKDVGNEWEKYVDPQYLVPKSFKVVLTTVMEHPDTPEPQAAEETYEDFMVQSMADTAGSVAEAVPNPPAHRRMSDAVPTPSADDDMDKAEAQLKREAQDQNGAAGAGDGDGHRNKRRRQDR
ncbi:hypothetical protein CC86DRAFT_371805 [Ophiobolus disseminans]|uniref:Uncharacterized protein n=1 Tax=Ophiobolus disseminans TaxID=1469910 RepID=A0A6A6ZVX9_9PLEO|nr:hypothetical protein CC86DRAFT_371805 [Ophiobolus disseminans]